jgi:hypothetical protein
VSGGMFLAQIGTCWLLEVILRSITARNFCNILIAIDCMFNQLHLG